MAFWKQKHNQTDGFSLVEVIVAITILGIVVVPMMSGLLFSYRLNLHSDEKMQAQLAVSSAVETIMAEGFNDAWYIDSPSDGDVAKYYYHNRFNEVVIKKDTSYSGAAYKIEVTARDMNSDTATLLEDISVETYVRPYATHVITDGDKDSAGGGTDE